MTYTPHDLYPYKLHEVDHEWRIWFEDVLGTRVTWRGTYCGKEFERWRCTLPTGHTCRHVGHLNSGEVCGLGDEVIPEELRVSEGL